MDRSYPTRRPRPGLVLALVAAAGLGTFAIRGELPQPILNTIHPCGGRQGTEVSVAIAGADLDDTTGLSFSHPGIVAKPVLAPPTEFDPEPRPVPGSFIVTIAADVPPGVYDVISTGRFGVSNQRSFVVGSMPEVAKDRDCSTPATAIDVPADASVGGRATAGKADHYAVSLRAGQRFHAEVWCRRIDSRMTPVVTVLDAAGKTVAVARTTRQEDPLVEYVAPADGRYVVRINDLFASGGDDVFYRLVLSTGPRIDFVFPPVAKSGDASRVQVVGRGLPGAAPANLPGGAADLEQVAVDVRAGDPSARAAVAATWRLFSPRDAFARIADLSGDVFASAPVRPSALVTAAPVVVEQEPNGTAAQAQVVELPACVAGTFHPRHDRDWFAFNAKAGDVLWFEVHSARLGLPTDPAILIESVSQDANGQPVGKEIAFVDDGPGEFQGPSLDRPSSDPIVEFRAPADGTYRVLVRDLTADSAAGPDHVYVLEARRPAPDFQLLALLAQQHRADANQAHCVATTLPVGGTVAIDVLVVRQDGFAGDIQLEAQGLPPGVTAAATVVPGRSNRGTLVLSAADGTAPWNGTIRVVGRSTIGADAVERGARVATLRWPVANQNQPHLLRQVAAIPLAVTVDTAPITVVEPQRAVRETARGGKVSVPLAVVRRAGAKGPLSLTVAGLPNELKVAEVKIEESAAAATAEIDVDPKLPAGTYPLVLRGVAKAAYQRNPESAARAKADFERVSALAQTRTAEVETAKQALAAADAKIAEAKAAGAEPAADVVAGREAAAKGLADAEARAKAAGEERARREKIANDAAAASAAKDIDVPVVVPAISLVVHETPVVLQGLPEKVVVKQAATVDLPVAFERRYGLAGDVQIEAAPGKPVAGLAVAPAAVPADQPAGVLKLTAAADSPPGTYDLVITTKCKFFDRDVSAQRTVPLVIEAAAPAAP